MVITAIISGLTAGVIVYSAYSKQTGMSYKTINNDTYLKEFLEVYSSINDEYYEDVNKEELVESAISAMLSYLGDSYTSFLSSEETDLLNESLAGEYQGIGVTISDHEIIEVFAKSPAEIAGVKVGDIITKINDKDVTKLNTSEVASLIKESNDESVSITVLRDDKEVNLNVLISTLYVPAITSNVIENTDIGYIRIATFSSSVVNQVSDALTDLKKENIKSLIIDVRVNSGGYLSAAEGISNLFLDKGKVIYTLKSKNSTNIVKDTSDIKEEMPVVVLIDSASASASEILAAALKDSYGAILVGNKSYGKGKVQQTVSLINGSMAKYTSAKWYRPNGECIDGVGIIPDYEVDIAYETDKDGNIINATDTQLNKAVELLSN